MMVRDDHSIDFRAIDAATRAIGAGLQPGTLVIYETTLPVGTTRNRFGAMLQQVSGLIPGVDFSLAFSPERIRTGQIFHDLAAYPKVVGGIDALSTQQAAAFYRTVLSAPVMTVSSAETAELTKLIETAYRDVNIALANEFAMFADARGIDVHEAIAAANSQPQSSIHEPGVGVGGHCIPVYPYFLMQDAHNSELQLSRWARSINDAMAEYAASQIAGKLGTLRDRSIVILGLAYRANVREAAFSSALRLIASLQHQGARVYINDPLFTDAELAATGAIPIDLGEIQLVDAIIVQAHHQQYTALNADFYRRASVVLDGRGNTNLAAMSLGETTLIRIGAPPVPPSMIA
jgi:nucleotide sugar dehydrogenase